MQAKPNLDSYGTTIIYRRSLPIRRRTLDPDLIQLSIEIQDLKVNILAVNGRTQGLEHEHLLAEARKFI